MPKAQTPTLRQALWAAADRYFLLATDLSGQLSQNPNVALQLLATNPQAFGEVRPSLDTQRQRHAHVRLVAAAEAYARAHASITSPSTAPDGGR